MSHRAEQIIDAVVEALRATAPAHVSIFAHRRLSLAIDAGELPAISVDYGDDLSVGADGAGYLDGTIRSVLTVNITGVAAEPDEATLRRVLLELRTAGHVAIKTNERLGLSFVLASHYGGADKPEINIESDQVVGELTSAWGVEYEMSANSPE